MPLDPGPDAADLRLWLGPNLRVRARDRVAPSFRWQLALALLPLGVIGGTPALYLALTDIGVYNSPDESSRYLTARAFAETGRLALSDAVSALDLQGAAGPRGFVQSGDDIVTIYPLGQPALVGLAYRFFGDATVFALALVPAALLAVLGVVLCQLRPRLPGAALLVIPAALPIWFWASFAHLDVGLTWLFVALGLLGWVQALRGGHPSFVLLGSAGFALAALMRHQEAPFLLLLALSMIAGLVWQNRHPLRVIAVLGFYAAPQVALFLWPMAELNSATYGGALTFGNTLFYKELFPERLPEEGGALAGALGMLWLAFFPQPVSGETMLKGLWFQIFLLSPPLVILGLYGAWIVRRSLLGAVGPLAAGGLVLTLAYVILSRSDPGVIGAGATAPDLSSSLTRYYWPIYIALALGAGIALSEMRRALARALVAGLLALGAYAIWLSPTDSVPAWQQQVISQHDRFAPLIAAATEPEAVIYTGNVDKWILGERRVISFWQEGGATYAARSMMDPVRVARDAATIHAAGLPVYFLFRPANGEDIAALEPHLAAAGLQAVWADRFARGLDLWRLETRPADGTVRRLSPDKVAVSWSGPEGTARLERRVGLGGQWRPIGDAVARGATLRDPLTGRPVFYRLAPATGADAGHPFTDAGPAAPLALSPAEPGWFVTPLEAAAAAASVWITDDGSSANAVTNPSFETGLDGWRGPAPGAEGRVERVTTRAASGAASLLMELADAPEGTRIARTLRIDAARLPAALWSLQARVLLAHADGVHVELRLIGKDAAGADVFFARTRAQGTDGVAFAPLAVAGARLPADTATVEVQLALISQMDGASALVFWDAVQLRPGDDGASTYLDGDRPGARWRGVAHASPSVLPGRIDAIRIAAWPGNGTPVAVTLPGPARTGDRIEIGDGHVSLRTVTGAVLATADFPEIAAGDRIEIALRSAASPALARVVEGYSE